MCNDKFDCWTALANVIEKAILADETNPPHRTDNLSDEMLRKIAKRRVSTWAVEGNPYDVQQLAGAILHSLDMSEEEQSARMRRLRAGVRENNIYRWAANLLSDLTEIRIDNPERVEAL